MNTKVSHIMRRSIRSLWENLNLNGMVVGVIAAALLLVGAYLQVLMNLDRMMTTWDPDVHVSAYFYEDISVEKQHDIMQELNKNDKVERIEYWSQEDAADFLKEEVESFQPILDEFGNSILPASLEITLRDAYTTPNEINAFVEFLEFKEASTNSDQTSFGEYFIQIDSDQEWVQRFASFVSLLQTLGIVVGILILTAAVFLVANTMHLVVYARRSELETMKLVGATFGFISAPFLVEGAILGILSSILATIGMLGVHFFLFERLADYLHVVTGEEHLAFLPPSAILAICLLGMFLGMAGCLKAVHRFWKAAQ